jgi:serine phosphatase RsbU (regulator of sigma subunit)
MTVSLIVGTLRTLVEYTQEPAEILRGLNRRLIGRIEGGFVTCLILRITADGEATLANAGHLPPFRGGKELPVSGSLPLGITTEASYEELSFFLHGGETLTLYTDGILEARNAKNELYGFARVSECMATPLSVEQIAEAASAFGQEDDITVLSITRIAATQQPHMATINLTAQIATS